MMGVLKGSREATARIVWAMAALGIAWAALPCPVLAQAPASAVLLPTVIQARINPATFGVELVAASVSEGVSYTDSAVTVMPSVSADALVKIQAVIAAHDPDKAAPIPVPQQVPMWAAQAALKQAGKYDAINAFVVGDPTASPPVPSMEASNPPVFFAWTMGNFASRHSAFIATLASQFGMTDADIDAVFRAADRIAKVAG